MTEKDIIALIHDDHWMMDILRLVRTLQLPDWWIGAGFVRSKVWDHLHQYTQRTPLPDIDVIYFNSYEFSTLGLRKVKEQEKIYEQRLSEEMSEVNWSVTNQARMHLFHSEAPYHSSEEALSRWVETATCIGVTLTDKNELCFTAPHGIEDLVYLILRPTPGVSKDTGTFYKRIEKKGWMRKWPRLQVVT